MPNSYPPPLPAQFQTQLSAKPSSENRKYSAELLPPLPPPLPVQFKTQFSAFATAAGVTIQTQVLTAPTGGTVSCPGVQVWRIPPFALIWYIADSTICPYMVYRGFHHLAVYDVSWIPPLGLVWCIVDSTICPYLIKLLRMHCGLDYLMWLFMDAYDVSFISTLFLPKDVLSRSP